MEKGYLTYKFRIYPNAFQRKIFSKTFGCVRFLYNKMLADKIEYYKKTKQQFYKSPAQYKKEFPWLKDVDSMALANALIDLRRAYNNFFTSTEYGFPKFKAKKMGKNSYTTNRVQGKKNVEIVGAGIKIPKIGIVKMKQHRSIPSDFTLKSATIMQNPNGLYYVSILFEYVKQITLRPICKCLGLDFSLHSFYVDSNGREVLCPRFFYKAEQKLSRENRKLSKMKKDSNNYYKQRVKVARIYEHIANQRRDFLHKQSRKIANSYDCVCVENLNMQDMAQTLNFGKAVGDKGWGTFVVFLKYKLENMGKSFVKIDKYFASSQVCHCCGYRNKKLKDFTIREWDCPVCGSHHDRDINAAINIKNEGMRKLLA